MGATPPAASNNTGGVGGAGVTSSITGSAVERASGGSGYNAADISGGGGTGSGSANTGGGAGTSGSGGSGVVILKMLTAKYSGTTTGSPTVTADGLYSILTYTSSGTYTT